MAPDEREQVRGRSMLVERLRPLAGRSGGARLSGRQRLGRIPGHPARSAAWRCRPGSAMRRACPSRSSRRPPRRRWATTTRTSRSRRWASSSATELAQQVRSVSHRAVPARGRDRAGAGIIIADTKFEFGLDRDGDADADGRGADPRFVALLAGRGLPGRAARRPQSAELRQAVRSRLARAGARRWPAWNKKPPAPTLPASVIERHRRQLSRSAAAADRMRCPREGPLGCSLQAPRARACWRGSMPISATPRSGRQSACLRAERAGQLARLGQFEQARQEVAALHAGFDRTRRPSVSAWLCLAEGCIAYFSSLSNTARDKMQRAHAISAAAHLPRIQALSAAWLAHMDFAQLDAEATATPCAAGARTGRCRATWPRWRRACLVIGVAYHFAERLDLAQPWYVAGPRMRQRSKATKRPSAR